MRPRICRDCQKGFGSLKHRRECLANRRVKEEMRRDTADGILETVKKKGRITMPTLLRLMKLLEEKTDYPYHVQLAVEVGALLKTIDNETDAKETVRRLEAKVVDVPQPQNGAVAQQKCEGGG